jgi:oligopeptide/dipeptide ABC transporter ATP-binding protein
MAYPLLKVADISKYFGQSKKMFAGIKDAFGARPMPSSENEKSEATSKVLVRAVDGVSFEIAESEVLGIVGESGCGKSTLGRMVAGIIDPTNGEIFWKGSEIGGSRRNTADKLKIQMVFQDPHSSLNARMRVRGIVGEAPLIHRMTAKSNLDETVDSLLDRVGLNPSFRDRFPHQLSGGQRQRVGIARALAVKPKLIVCDEPVSALDISVQAQVLNLFLELKEDLGLTYMFISHDLSVIRHLADRVCVMYLGKIVEEGTVEEIFNHPMHPYTQGLIDNIPRIEARKQTYVAIRGEIPSAMSPPKGCPFHPRCKYVMDICRIKTPEPRAVAPGHKSACHLQND